MNRKMKHTLRRLDLIRYEWHREQHFNRWMFFMGVRFIEKPNATRCHRLVTLNKRKVKKWINNYLLTI